jgi:AraC-like DNA-binding protein
MRLKLFEARFAERMWETARALVDDWKTRTLPTIGSEVLAYLGVHRVPRHVLVGSLVAVEKDPDPLALLLRCHAFQRACAATARKVGNMLAGQAGDHGVFFLADFAGSRARTVSKLGDLAARAAASARRFGLRLHAGADLTPDAALPARYRSALANAECATERGVPIVCDEPRSRRSDRALARLRHGLARGIEARPDLLDARFESYIEAAMALAGNRIESLRRELDAGLERLTEPLLATGALDEKSFDDLAAAMARAVARATTTAALIDSYRSFIIDIRGAIEHSIGSRQERGTRRAALFIREHLSEPLTLPEVARLAGFAPGYFSKLFKQSEGTTFQHYLLALRLERATEMLEGTKLGVERVRQLSGFRNRAYFNRAFKKAMGVSPRDHRRHFTTRMRREAGYEPRHPAGTLSPG